MSVNKNVTVPAGRATHVTLGRPGEGRDYQGRTDRAVQLLTQDVSVPGVTIGLVEDVDQDVEELHVRAWPPRQPLRKRASYA